MADRFTTRKKELGPAHNKGIGKIGIRNRSKY